MSTAQPCGALCAAECTALPNSEPVAAPSAYFFPLVPFLATAAKSWEVQPSLIPASVKKAWLSQRVEPGSGRSRGMP
ncbi:hypothetical protein [Streptomyces mirabilis]|uniref:hypothetical protein n=1 Tax=Streptomyces mirabilis TaxID=68239 RepID=UPI0036820EA9